MQLGLTKLQLCDMPEYGEEELFKVKDCVLWNIMNLRHLSSLTRLQVGRGPANHEQVADREWMTGDTLKPSSTWQHFMSIVLFILQAAFFGTPCVHQRQRQELCWCVHDIHSCCCQNTGYRNTAFSTLALHRLLSVMQDLRLSVRDATDAILDVLAPSLTKLHLEGFWGDLHTPNLHEVEIKQETCRSFSCLTNLQHLDMSKVETYVDTSMLKDLISLTVRAVTLARLQHALAELVAQSVMLHLQHGGGQLGSHQPLRIQYVHAAFVCRCLHPRCQCHVVIARVCLTVAAIVIRVTPIVMQGSLLDTPALILCLLRQLCCVIAPERRHFQHPVGPGRPWCHLHLLVCYDFFTPFGPARGCTPTLH